VHKTSIWQLLTSQRANLPCTAIQISCKIHQRIPVSSEGERRETPVATTHGLRMAEAAGDIPAVIGGLGRWARNKTIYRTLGVAGQKDFRSGEDFMKDAASRRARDMCVR
jgi:hypothetical protein